MLLRIPKSRGRPSDLPKFDWQQVSEKNHRVGDMKIPFVGFPFASATMWITMSAKLQGISVPRFCFDMVCKSVKTIWLCVLCQVLAFVSCGMQLTC